MSFFRDLSTVSARGPLAASVLAVSALLAACGGGAQQETFQPNRIVVFGDENSLIEANGRQYSVNNIAPVATTNPNGISCINNPIWVEYVAADYGLPFGECRGDNSKTKDTAIMKATVGARIADVAAALSTVTPALNNKDLVTVMVGSYDLLDLARANKTPTTTERAQMIAAAGTRGREFGAVVMNIVGSGARVIFATVPYLGSAPVAAAEGIDVTLLNAMTVEFKNRLADATSAGGGHNGAVLETDDLVKSYYDNRDLAYSNIINRTTAACVTGGAPTPAAQLPNCTTTDVTTASPVYYLWAGEFQFGAITQGLIGQSAVQRIRANPL